MRHKAYNDYFRSIAANHVEIKHSEKSQYPRFFRIILTEDLFPTDYLAELIAAQKTKITRDAPFMILESYTKDVDDNKTGSAKGMCNAAFYILHTPTKEDYADQEAKLDQCEAIAEDIMAYMAESFGERCGSMLLPDYHIHTIANVGAGPYFGVKCHFRFMTRSESSLYRPERWMNPLA
jgi:hypothetical protein